MYTLFENRNAVLLLYSLGFNRRKKMIPISEEMVQHR